MQRLNNRGLTTDLQILYNEASQNYKAAIKYKCGVDLQLVPPNIHRRNEAEREIRTFKVHFLAVLSEVAPDFPQFLWDLLLVQTEMNLNFLHQSTFNRTISYWEYFAGSFQYDATSLGSLGMNIIIQKKASRHHSWDFRGNSIMQRLNNRGLITDLQILYNEASKNYKDTSKDKWGMDFQLVPPDIHRRNASERAIRTFKGAFVSSLVGGGT